jgi:tetratricopeptide (TPR) repeat protein
VTLRSSRPALCALFAAAAAFSVFLPSLTHGWVGLDDPMFLLEPIGWRGLSLANWRWDLSAGVGGVYQPLAWLSYGLDYALWGLDPRGYHLQSALWHALSAGLFFLVSRRVLGAASGRSDGEDWRLDAAALFSALVFAVHPLRVESVAWASERRDVVCCAFFIAATLSYLRAREPGRPARSLVPTAALFLPALLAKGMALTLPAILLVLDAWPLRRVGPRGEGLRTAASEKIPLFALSAAFALVGTAVQHRLRWTWEQHGAAGRLAQTAYSLAFYARKTLWPSGLLPMYELRPPLNPWEFRFLGSLAAVGVAMWACLRLRRERPWAAAAAGAYALLLLPVCGLFQFGPQLAADRYSYIACLPFALVAGGVFRAALVRGPRVSLAAGAAIALVLAAASARQQTYWASTEALWIRVLSGDPISGIAHESLGREYAGIGRLREAETHLHLALDAFPGCAADQDRLAGILAGDGADPAEARRLRASVETNPVCRKARANLGALLAQKGDWEGARRILSVVAAVAPEDGAVRLNLQRVDALLARRRQPR